MNKRNQLQWLDRQTAPLGPFLILCLNKEDYVKAMKHLNVPIVSPWVVKNKSATAHSCVCGNGDLAVVVCIRPQPRPLSEMLAMLVHEATHVWQHYATGLGEKYPGDEQEAYAIQLISQELIQSFFDQTKSGRYGKFTKKYNYA